MNVRTPKRKKEAEENQIELNNGFCESPEISTQIDEKKLGSYQKYTPIFKLQLIEEAKKSSNRSTARRYNLDEKLIRNWRKAEDKIQVTRSAKRLRFEGAG